jgi:hypothetical protein
VKDSSHDFEGENTHPASIGNGLLRCEGCGRETPDDPDAYMLVGPTIVALCPDCFDRALGR